MVIPFDVVRPFSLPVCSYAILPCSRDAKFNPGPWITLGDGRRGSSWSEKCVCVCRPPGIGHNWAKCQINKNPYDSMSVGAGMEESLQER